MGMRIRRIVTERKVINGKTVVVPVLDAQGQEQELWSIDVPTELESRLPKDVDYSNQEYAEQAIETARQELQEERETERLKLEAAAREQQQKDEQATTALNATTVTGLEEE